MMKKIQTALQITVLIITSIAALAIIMLRGNIGMSLQPGRNEFPESPSPTAELSATPSPTPTPAPTPTPTHTPSPTPTPEPTPEPEPELFVISMVGDCTLASSQHHKGTALAFETVVGEDYAYPFAKTLQYFENDYLSLANLEGTFTTAAASNGGTFVFKSDPVYANVLTQGSIEMVVLGNNHAGDFLEQGRLDTMAALDAAGVHYADEDGWCIYQRSDGIKIGVYSKLYPTANQVIAGVTALKEAGAEIIIAALHWGIEGTYRATADQENVGHAAIDAGAHIVYGSHPHVLQRTEEYNGGYIFYSLGNWSFGGNTAPRDRDTAIAQVTVMRDIDGGISLVGYELIPCKLSGTDAWNDYQPAPYEEGSEEYLRAMSKLDGTFTGPDLTIDYSAFHDDGNQEAPSEGGDVPSEGGDAPAEDGGAE